MGHVSSVRAVDNTLISIEVEEEEKDSLNSWNGHIRYTPKYGGRQTTADIWALELAPKSAFAAGVESIRGRERQRFSLVGGEVVVFDCADLQDARWATWIGPWNMAHGMFYAPLWESADIVEIFTRLQWNDTPEGLTADPGQRFNLQKAVYLLSVAGVGTLMVESKRTTADRIPKWRGYTALSGEIWQLPVPPTGGAQPLLMVTDTATVTMSPWDVPRKGQAGASSRMAAGTAETAADFLSKVKRVDWVI